MDISYLKIQIKFNFYFRILQPYFVGWTTCQVEQLPVNKHG